jgi:hypothetical protein
MTSTPCRPRNINANRYNKSTIGKGPGERSAQTDTERCGVSVKTVHIAYPTGNSNVAMKAPITMPKGPWK